jgi:hypothetical protein
MVRAEEVNYLERKHFGVVVACIPKGDRQGDPSKGDGLLTQDHSVKPVWADLNLVLGKPQSLKGIEVHDIEVAARIHEGLGELGCPNQRVGDEGKPLWLRYSIWVVHLVESDQRSGPAQVLQDCHAHRVGHLASELEFAT